MKNAVPDESDIINAHVMQDGKLLSGAGDAIAPSAGYELTSCSQGFPESLKVACRATRWLSLDYPNDALVDNNPVILSRRVIDNHDEEWSLFCKISQHREGGGHGAARQYIRSRTIAVPARFATWSLPLDIAGHLEYQQDIATQTTQDRFSRPLIQITRQAMTLELTNLIQEQGRSSNDLWQIIFAGKSLSQRLSCLTRSPTLGANNILDRPICYDLAELPFIPALAIISIARLFDSNMQYLSFALGISDQGRHIGQGSRERLDFAVLQRGQIHDLPPLVQNYQPREDMPIPVSDARPDIATVGSHANEYDTGTDIIARLRRSDSHANGSVLPPLPSELSRSSASSLAARLFDECIAATPLHHHAALSAIRFLRLNNHSIDWNETVLEKARVCLGPLIGCDPQMHSTKTITHLNEDHLSFWYRMPAELIEQIAHDQNMPAIEMLQQHSPLLLLSIIEFLVPVRLPEIVLQLDSELSFAENDPHPFKQLVFNDTPLHRSVPVTLYQFLASAIQVEKLGHQPPVLSVGQDNRTEPWQIKFDDFRTVGDVLISKRAHQTADELRRLFNVIGIAIAERPYQ